MAFNARPTVRDDVVKLIVDPVNVAVLVKWATKSAAGPLGKALARSAQATRMNRSVLAFPSKLLVSA